MAQSDNIEDLSETWFPHLQAAWDNAEPTEVVNKGDIVICRVNEWNFRTYRSRATFTPAKYDQVRIVKRAREPWADLADVLATNNGELIGEHHTITEVAKALHERGVRVVGGDDDDQ